MAASIDWAPFKGSGIDGFGVGCESCLAVSRIGVSFVWVKHEIVCCDAVWYDLPWHDITLRDMS